MECSIEEIKSRDDLGDLMELGEEMGVNLEGLITSESFKERLILHILKQTNEKHFDMNDAGFERMKTEQEKKTKSIIELLNKVRSSLKPCIKPISTILQAGQTTNDLSADFNSHIADLQHEECSIVFSGETSSGKSSLLNLVLGYDILPTHAVSCTFIISKLKYSQTFKSNIIYKDGTQQQYDYKSSQEAKESLNEIIFEKSQCKREEGSVIKEIHILLPADILKSGITIIDTPGIGENSELNSLVVKFLSSTSITGFIYLIRTDTAGGIQEDRLPDFLREIRKLRKKTSISSNRDGIATKSAMFICNRWDLIRESELEKVRENALSKLSDTWPGFKQSQAVFFSTEQAAQHANIDRDYITEDFAALLNQLIELIQTSLDTRIKNHYTWLKGIIQQATSHVISLVSQINKTDEELRLKFREAKNKLKDLKSNAVGSLSYLRQIIDDETEILADKIKSFLDNCELKDKIRAMEINVHNNLRRMSTISVSTSGREAKHSEYDSVALRLLIEEIDKWILTNRHAEQMTTKVEDIIHSNLEVLKGDVDAITSEMTDNNSLSSSTAYSIVSEDELCDMLSSVGKDRKLIHRISDIAEGRSDKNLILQPKVLVARAILSAVYITKPRRGSAVSRDPNEYVKERAIEFIDTLLKDDSLIKKICSRYTENLLIYLEKIELSIPLFIKTNKELMQEIQNSRHMTVENKEVYATTLGHLVVARELLRGFECVYVNDLKTKSITLPSEDLGTLSRSSRDSIEASLTSSACSRLSYGICFSTQQGTATLNGHATSIISRTSNVDVSEDCLFKEISKLRHLQCENIATFEGMLRREQKAVFIFSGYLRPINIYLAKSHIRDIQTLTYNIIYGIINGLSRLHKSDLVHMELSTKTIMINTATEEVKLIGGCLPRKMCLPENDSVAVQYLTYLSPDVLRGQLYSKADDVYSLGLVIWKLLFQRDPYHQYMLLMDQSTFIGSVDPKQMLSLDEEWPAPLRYMFIRCLHASPAERLTVDGMKSYLEDADLNPILSKLRNSRRKPIKGLSDSKLSLEGER